MMTCEKTDDTHLITRCGELRENPRKEKKRFTYLSQI